MSQYSYEPNAPQKSRMDQAAEMGQQAFDQATEAATVARDTWAVLRWRSARCGSCNGRARPLTWIL
jgi:hypothetical protein